MYAEINLVFLLLFCTFDVVHLLGLYEKMTQEQEVDLTVVDSHDWQETDQKIEQIQNIFAEEGLADDPALMDALHQAVHASVKGEIVDVDVE